MSERSWVEGIVDVHGEHMVLNYRDDPTPVAWLSRDHGAGFTVQFNTDGDGRTPVGRDAVTQELDDALNGAGDGEAWREAIRRCGVDGAGESPVHWGYFPLEPIFDGNGGGPE